MVAYAIRRVILIIPLIFAVATITFFLMHLVEGGPFDGERPISPRQREALEQRYGLDDPIPQQYVKFMGNLITGDLGISFRGDQPITEILRERAPTSAELGASAFLFAVLLGTSLGIFSALNQNGPLDYVGVFVATAGAALPSFVLAPLLQIGFALKLDWFDVLGWELFNYQKMVLPTIALGMLPAAFIARITRASMLDILRQDYVRTARAKGVTEFRVVMRHAVKNAMIPVLTILGPIFAGLITGSFIVERAFQIPGIGTAFVNSVAVRDYGLIMGVTLFFTIMIAFMNLIVDLLYAVVDPRIRL